MLYIIHILALFAVALLIYGQYLLLVNFCGSIFWIAAITTIMMAFGIIIHMIPNKG
jgi:hypothetical protein